MKIWRDGKRVWERPIELIKFLCGWEISEVESERIKSLVLQMDSLLNAFVSAKKGLGTQEELQKHYDVWGLRLAMHFADPKSEFFKDLVKAHKLWPQHGVGIKSPKQCLASAYIALTCDPLSGEAEEFLKSCDGAINTATVRQFAELLWEADQKKHSDPQQMDLLLKWSDGRIILEAHWYRLFQELGLTEKILPRDRGGRRPGKVSRRSKKCPKRPK